MNDEDVAPGSVPPLKYVQDRHKKIRCFGKSLFGASLKKKEKEKSVAMLMKMHYRIKRGCCCSTMPNKWQRPSAKLV